MSQSGEGSKEERAIERSETLGRLTSELRGVAKPPIDPSQNPPGKPIFFVGIGASAGGLEALGRFFGSMPAQNGMAFVVVQHLSPDHKSFMVELLSRRSQMRVLQAMDGQPLLPDHVYLLPPRKFITVFHGKIVLEDHTHERGLRLPIDMFFRSLAEDQKGQAIGVILSGTGSDGSLGVRAIKEAGGMVMVQSESSAEFDGMPRSAISTGLADFVGRPEDLPNMLAQYVQHPFATKLGNLSSESAEPEPAMRQLFVLMRERTGVDFSDYKPGTIDRRIERRMSVQQVEAIDSYVRFLRGSVQESEALFNNLLICVTRFFRDRDLWETLEQDILPKLLQQLDARDTFRAWLPGCSTGEEAYSLAIVLSDVMEKLGLHREVKIFATDVSKKSLDVASTGLYTATMVAEITPDRLAKHFDRRTDGFQINARLRKFAVFARHDVLKDPPFSRMDLVCCRNLLIYFQPQVQSRVLQSLRHALKPDGILVLGSSESTGDLADRFNTLNSRLRLYRPKPGTRGLSVPLPLHSGKSPPTVAVRSTRDSLVPEVRTSLDYITRGILNEFAPATFVVDENGELLHLFGRAGELLRHPDGSTTSNILRLTSHNLSSALGPALYRASRNNAEFTFENIRIHQGEKEKTVRLRVRPIHPPGQQGKVFLVFIEEMSQRPLPPAGTDFQEEHGSSQRVLELEQELAQARENLQATVEELETSNEELQASNEELLAANEELQSTNEELQSVNEELHTVNEELKIRVDEVINLSNDLSNMFTSASIGIAFLDKDLRMRKLASAIFSLTGITPSDAGAPLDLLARHLASPELCPRVLRVLETGMSDELEILTPKNLNLRIRVVPFMTETGSSSGLLLTVMDITTESQCQARIHASENMLFAVLDSMPSQIAVLDESGTITHVNRAWTEYAAKNSGSLKASNSGIGSNYFEICEQVKGPEYHQAQAVLTGMKAVLEGKLPVFRKTYPCHFRNQKRWFELHVARLQLPNPLLIATHTQILAQTFPPPEPEPEPNTPDELRA